MLIKTYPCVLKFQDRIGKDINSLILTPPPQITNFHTTVCPNYNLGWSTKLSIGESDHPNKQKPTETYITCPLIINPMGLNQWHEMQVRCSISFQGPGPGSMCGDSKRHRMVSVSQFSDESFFCDLQLRLGTIAEATEKTSQTYPEISLKL